VHLCTLNPPIGTAWGAARPQKFAVFVPMEYRERSGKDRSGLKTEVAAVSHIIMLRRIFDVSLNYLSVSHSALAVGIEIFYAARRARYWRLTHRHCPAVCLFVRLSVCLSVCHVSYLENGAT